MKWLVLLAAVPALAVPVVLGGCAAFTDEPVGLGDGVQVAAGFYPLAWVAEEVGGDRVEVTDLTRPGGEPHDLEPSVEQTAAIARADLVVHERGFQPAVDAAVDQNAEGEVLDVADVVRLVPFREHGVDSDEPDPHFWQDPLLVADVADAVAARLAGIDPRHAEDYTSRAARLRGELEILDRDYRQGLRGCARDTVVVTHDAFGYLQRYGVHMEAILGLSPDSEPTPAGLARLQQLVHDDGVTTIFSESIGSADAAESLADATGVRSAVLDPVEGLTDRTADQDYLSLMRANLAALEEANGC